MKPLSHRSDRTPMNLLNFAPRVLLLLAVLSFGTERELRAYTDPGTGALLWQTLAASVVGVLFYFRRFTSWLRRKKDSQD